MGRRKEIFTRNALLQLGEDWVEDGLLVLHEKGSFSQLSNRVAIAAWKEDRERVGDGLKGPQWSA